MGYYTNYSLEVKGCENKEQEKKLYDTLKDKDLLGYAFMDLDPEKHGYHFDKFDLLIYDTYDAVKWYEYDDDMYEISLLFPNMTFCLTGSGDAFGDNWAAYYKNGASEVCRATIPPPQNIKW